MDIERLRALEKEIRDEAGADIAESCNPELAEWVRDKALARGSAKRGCANRIANLIAELGQEVGAVAWTDDRGLERLREGKQEMVSGVRLGSDTTPLYLHPERGQSDEGAKDAAFSDKELHMLGKCVTASVTLGGHYIPEGWNALLDKIAAMQAKEAK